MIEFITPEHAEEITDLLNLYRNAKNRFETYPLNSRWVSYVISRIELGERSAVIYRGKKNEGLVLFQTGSRTVYASLLFVRRGPDRNKIFRRLLTQLKSMFSDKTIMLAETAPDFPVDLQKELFVESGYEVGSRFEMIRKVSRQKLVCSRPEGFQIKKFKSSYLKQLNRLDREAYRGEPDQILFEIVDDIGNSSPALKIVSSNLGRFDKSMSEFIFHGSDLAAAIYCVIRGSDLLVANIATAPGYRKMGLASLLLSRVLNRLGSAGYAGCRLFVTSNNKKAINLYKKFDFRVERNRIYSVYRSGQGEVLHR